MFMRISVRVMKTSQLQFDRFRDLTQSYMVDYFEWKKDVLLISDLHSNRHYSYFALYLNAYTHKPIHATGQSGI